LTSDQYYLLKALVLANSDDLTLASSAMTAATAGKNHGTNRTVSKGDDVAVQQQQSAVKQFRATIARALQTHLEMTVAVAAVSNCCCCDGSSNCCSTPAVTMDCCNNSGATTADGSGMTTNCCSCCCKSNSNNNTASNQLDNGGEIVVVVDNHQQQVHRQPQQHMDTSGISTTDASASTVVVVGLVTYLELSMYNIVFLFINSTIILINTF